MQLNRKKEAADLHGTDIKLLEFICSQSVKLKFFHILFVIIQKQYDDMASRYRGGKRLYFCVVCLSCW